MFNKKLLKEGNVAIMISNIEQAKAIQDWANSNSSNGFLTSSIPPSVYIGKVRVDSHYSAIRFATPEYYTDNGYKIISFKDALLNKIRRYKGQN